MDTQKVIFHTNNGNLNIGDNYSINISGELTPQLLAFITSHQQQLFKGLEKFVVEAPTSVKTNEERGSVVAVNLALMALSENKTNEFVTRLKQAGIWALNVAKEIGINVVADAISKALGIS